GATARRRARSARIRPARAGRGGRRDRRRARRCRPGTAATPRTRHPPPRDARGPRARRDARWRRSAAFRCAGAPPGFRPSQQAWGVEPRLPRAYSTAWASPRGGSYVPSMAVIRLQEVVVDCRDPRALVGFWAAVLRAVPVVRTDEWAYLDSDLL